MANPAFNENTYDRFGQGGPNGYGYAQAQAVPQTEVMTVEGTLNKTLILFALLFAGAALTWSMVFAGMALSIPLIFGGLLGAFIVGLVTAFRPQSARITAPIYAILEGLFVGGFSALMQNAYHGIVGQAVALTLAVCAIMFGVYRSGLIKVTEKLKMGIIGATGAIALVYLISNLMLLFGNPAMGRFFWSNNPVSIGISLLVTGVAAFNLLLDFDVVEQGVQRRAPKFMEWYAGYGFMVTIVWLYLEILRLLAKFSRR